MSVALMPLACPVSDALAVALAPFSEKRIANAADTTPKSAGRWKRGEAVPSGDALLRMMAADDELFTALLAAAGRADHAARARAIHHLVAAVAALEGRP
jgi:hypothetical protein